MKALFILDGKLSIRFKDEYHGTSSKPSNFLRTHGYINAWFDKHSVRK